MRALTDEIRLKILFAYANGETIRAIAERFGVSNSYPSVIAHKAGITRGASEDECRQALENYRRPPAPPPIEVEPAPQPAEPDAAVAAEIRRLASKGIPRTGIAALLRCGNRQVSAVLD